jgi:phage terminase small subunit
MTKIPPPDSLSHEARKIWERVETSRFSTGRLILLEQALLTLDRANQARAIIEREGLITVTKRSGVPHLHPAVKIEKENRHLFMKTWKAIGLGWDPFIDGH